MSEMIDVLVLVDEGYEGQEALQAELGPRFRVQISESQGALEAAISQSRWPLVLVPRALGPKSGDRVLQEVAAWCPEMIGLLLIDDMAAAESGAGVHILIRRPLAPGVLTQHLEAAARLRETLVGMAAAQRQLSQAVMKTAEGLQHELRGQLHGCLGLLGMVREELTMPEPCLDDIREMATRMDLSAARLVDLIDMVSDWLLMVQRELRPARLELSALLEEIAVMGGQARAEHGGRLRLVVEGGPFWVRADEGLLRKALQGLLALCVEDRPVAWRLGVGEGGYEIEVGPLAAGPLDEGSRERGVALYNREVARDGIRLAYARRVIKRHGGSLELRPGGDSGEAVLLRLPFGDRGHEDAVPFAG